MSTSSNIILSNRGKPSMSLLLRGGISGLILVFLGILILANYESFDYGYRDRFMIYLLPVVGILFLALGVFVIVQALLMQRSFLELTADGACGASMKEPKVDLNAKLTPPRYFSLRYSEIQRADVEKGYILLVSGSVTYRCRANGMEEAFLQALKSRIK